MTLTADQARSIATRWREQFVDETFFDQSCDRFFQLVGDPTPGKFDAWLAKDQVKDAARNAVMPREPLLPVRQHFELSDCWHCGGSGYVRLPGWSPTVAITDPSFGKARRCPACADPHHACPHCR
jgi:hypothetical protein